MRIESNWKLMFDPEGAAVTLLSYGDMVDSELAWSLKKTLQVTPLDESAAPYLRHAGNAVYNISFRMCFGDVTDSAARKNMMDYMILIPTLVKKPLRVGVSGITEVTGTYWQFSNSYITEYSLTRDPDNEGFIASIAFTATGLVQVGA